MLSKRSRSHGRLVNVPLKPTPSFNWRSALVHRVNMDLPSKLCNRALTLLRRLNIANGKRLLKLYLEEFTAACLHIPRHVNTLNKRWHLLERLARCSGRALRQDTWHQHSLRRVTLARQNWF